MLLELLAIFVVTISLRIYKLFFVPLKDYWSKYGIRQSDTSVALTPFDILLVRKGLTEADDYAFA